MATGRWISGPKPAIESKNTLGPRQNSRNLWLLRMTKDIRIILDFAMVPCS